jgi:hypothetical protein
MPCARDIVAKVPAGPGRDVHHNTEGLAAASPDVQKHVPPFPIVGFAAIQYINIKHPEMKTIYKFILIASIAVPSSSTGFCLISRNT